MFTKKQKDLTEEEKCNLGAMNARIKRHHFKVSYPGDTKFPYNVQQIALALDYLNKTLKEEKYETETPIDQDSKEFNALNMPILKTGE